MLKNISIFMILTFICMISGCYNSNAMGYADKTAENYTQKFSSPKSAFSIVLPSDIVMNSEPKEMEAYEELKPYISSNKTSLPGQAIYEEKQNTAKQSKFSFMCMYASYDLDKIEQDFGQPFHPNLDGAVEMYRQSMERSSKAGSKYTQDLECKVDYITVDNEDARLLTTKFKNQGYPVVCKVVFVSFNNDVWQIGFNCDGKSEETVKNVEKMIKTIKFMR